MISKKISIVILFFTLLSFVRCTVTETKQRSLPRSNPEAESVSSQSIINFLDAVENSSNELHSFMFLRHGKVIAEGWWDPYKPDLRHTMYSTSKSFVSTAIGLAVDEKRLTVNDKVISFFPEYLPDTVSENLAALEIQHLLTMSVGQDPEPTFSSIVHSENWIKSFLETPIVNRPGSEFLYNSSATYMLAAIVYKVTGENVIDYLKPGLFDPLHITGMDWEVDPMGINTGGWGLRIKTEDMAKFGQLYLQKGNWCGEQLIPEQWIEEASSSKIEQVKDTTMKKEEQGDWGQGYGYKFWRSRHNAYRADGAYGQFIIILPEKDAVIAITAETMNMQDELNLVWENLLPGFRDGEVCEDENNFMLLKERLKGLALIPPPSNNLNPIQNQINNKTYTFSENNVIETLSLSFVDNTCTLYLNSGKEVPFSSVFGADEWVPGNNDNPPDYLLPPRNNLINILAPFKVAGAYSWITENTLELTLRYIESPHTYYLTCQFSGEQINLQITDSKTNRTNKNFYQGQELIIP